MKQLKLLEISQSKKDNIKSGANKIRTNGAKAWLTHFSKIHGKETSTSFQSWLEK